MLLFCTGFFLFLGGLEGCKWSIKNVITGRVKNIIISLDNHTIFSIIIGILIASIMQSSSAVSMILISLIESRTLSLKSAICIMLGANIGTTITVQIISLPVLNYFPYLIIIAVTINIIAKIFNKKRYLYLGTYIFFFAVVFAGLLLMSNFFKLPANTRLIMNILKYSSKKLHLGLITGTIITAIIQSSSAVTGIVLSLALNQMISLKTAVAVTLGSNIGTCITAFLASINAGNTSKKLAKSHFLFNLIGVISILPVFTLFINLITITCTYLSGQIANAHTFFNIYNLLIFLPFLNSFISWVDKE